MNATPWDTLSPEEAELQYNPQRSAPDHQAVAARRAPVNEAALATLRRTPDIAFGPGALHKLDLYHPQGTGPFPVHGFLHGGYWRAQDKRNFAFTATELVKRGVLVAVLNYDLCPAVTLDGTVASALAGIEWLIRHAAEHGGDPARLTLSGHSAGAHLVAAALATDWAARGLPAQPFHGALLISGIYNPAPAMRTTVNAEIRLTEAIAARHNYAAQAPLCHCPAWVMAGGDEPVLWLEQSFAYARHLHRHGKRPGVLVTPGHHHFDILDQYAAPESDLQLVLQRLAC
ncbi:alpha/beta hydrolase fold domain-containing protein [Siccirubricoccus sp. KC 17139]|uniref:Alpha/beta hydrolase fold domain-containing protein n=1 Tax=Siccirubricoccus soli TaxID=2899147 RepID=A0ABT1D2D4_9PROT|nr:alpha/beta hydrolase [Siccirubricoccus soli]MCO6415772.1 alpha/beta hydrolase fold domain-containing protein [Siccirubricoccus soli]MCP2681904.1 alpha/beta hydrolase fold domain-containing protein [Siccirubricoccus soli]